MGHYTSKSRNLIKHTILLQWHKNKNQNPKKKKEVSNIELQLAFSNYTIACFLCFGASIILGRDALLVPTSMCIKCNKRSAVVGVCEHCTAGATFTFFEWNGGPVKLDIPRILVILSSWTHMRRWPLHLHSPWDVPSFHGRPPWPAWLPLNWICRPLLWCTLRPGFCLWGLCVCHVIWEQRVVIGQRLSIIWPRKSKGCSWWVKFGHGRIALRAALCCAERIVLNMCAAGSRAQVSESWWSWGELVVAVLVWVGLIWCMLSGKSVFCSLCLWELWIAAISALQNSLWVSMIHLHNLNVLFHASLHFIICMPEPVFLQRSSWGGMSRRNNSIFIFSHPDPLSPSSSLCCHQCLHAP